eukprot:13579378-Alexandrium_andersonii.AAC.1
MTSERSSKKHCLSSREYPAWGAYATTTITSRAASLKPATKILLPMGWTWVSLALAFLPSARPTPAFSLDPDSNWEDNMYTTSPTIYLSLIHI